MFDIAHAVIRTGQDAKPFLVGLAAGAGAYAIGGVVGLGFAPFAAYVAAFGYHWFKRD